MTSRIFRTASLALAAALAVAVGHAAAQDTAGGPRAAQADPSTWPRLPGGLLIRPAIETYLDQLLPRLSLEDKVGQLVQADIGSMKPDDLRRYHLGSVLAGGFAAPGGNVHADGAAWRAMVAQYKAAAVQPGNGAAIPILFGIDAVHGDAKVRGATVFPHNVGLGAAHDPALLERIGAATAQEVAATGIDWAFAPTLAVARDPRWGRAFESYSDDPAEVARDGAAMVAGLQGRFGTPDFLAAGRVISSAKHFVGDGGTTDGHDQGNADVPESVLRDVHAAGYPAAIGAGVTTVMASYNSWQGAKMHGNRSLLTGVLKQRWGFDGFVIGDWNAQEELPNCTKFDCAAMVNAGVDMVMAPDSWRLMYVNLLSQARSGAIPMARIDDAVRRILRVKALAGLIGPQARTAGLPDLAVIGSAAHRALARQAVRESLVLLKNDHALLPLAAGRRVLVMGTGADAIGQQTGGWTVDWQGATNANADLPGATSIFAGIRQAVGAAGGTATLSPDGSYTDRPDVAIVVYGEQPYAEFQGDRETLALPDGPRIAAVLQRLHAAGIPTVSVLLTGRPLWVNPQLNRSDAFVVAWLPGSEGEGVADLLFRPATGPAPVFTGRLGFPWPATAMPVQYAADGTVGKALFARGYGLAGGDARTAAALPEDPAIPAAYASHDSFFDAGHAIAPWSIFAGDSLAEVRMTQPLLVSPGHALTTQLIDGGVQAHWAGTGTAVWRIGGRPVDLAAAAAAGRGIALRYRLLAGGGDMQLGMLCGAQCGGWLTLDRAAPQRARPPSGWQTRVVPLACFAQAGADLHAVETPFALRTAGPATIAIARIALSILARPAPCPR